MLPARDKLYFSFLWDEDITFYYIDTDELPGFFLLLKIISSSNAVKIIFLSFTCEDIGVAVVTNIISQNVSLLHQNFDFLEREYISIIVFISPLYLYIRAS